MTSPLRQVTPEERLLETMRLIRDKTSDHIGNRFARELWELAGTAVLDYYNAMQVQRTANSLVIRGEIQSKGGR